MGIIFFLAFSVVISAVLILAFRRARGLATNDWNTLVARIEPVAFPELERVALEHLHPNGKQLQLEPNEIWKLLGGASGLARMQQNAKLMIELAAYVQVWNFEEAVIVSERIRQDAITMNRALHRIRFRNFFPAYRLRVPFYAHQAAASYYLMTRRLLALYETSQYVLYPRLAEVL